MKKLIGVALAVLCAAVASSAPAATTTVTITKNGYVPNAVTISQGDSVQFTNGDSVAHQVTFKSTTGISCSPSPLVLQPGQSGTCTFAVAGSYSYDDPNIKGKTFTGKVTVTAAAESLSLAASPLIVVYGGGSTLSGTLSTHQAGENVDVLAQVCGASTATRLTTVQTTTGGAYSAVVHPLKNTAYTVKVRKLASLAATVRARPRLRLRKIAAHRYSLRIAAAQSFAGRYASFRRYNRILHRWVAVRTLLLHSSSAGVAPTVITTASFRSSIKPRLRVRTTLPQRQVGGCYLAGTSNTISS